MGEGNETKFAHTETMNSITSHEGQTGMITVLFENVTDDDGNNLGHYHGEGETVNDAWDQVRSNLVARGESEPLAYDDWRAA